MKEKGGIYHVTVAAILLFGMVSTQFLTGARVHYMHYEGVTAEVSTRFNLLKDIKVILKYYKV